MSDRSDKSYRGDASQFFIAGELCRRGIVAVITMGNCPNTDILCSNSAGTKSVHIQVKTFVPGNRTCSIGLKAEKDYGENFFWVLGGIPEPDEQKEFEFFIIPSNVMAKNVKESHQLWLDTKGKNGQPHKDGKFRSLYLPPYKSENGWDIGEFRNRWDIIEEKLHA